MRTLLVALVATAWLCADARAQESPPADGSRIAERFRQLDRNGDGRLTREEAPPGPFFDRWDADGDGAVTLAEVEAFYGKRRAGQTPTDPSKAGTPQDFAPDAPFVGEIGGSYIDPEFSEEAAQVVFQDAQNRVWIGDIDPDTGLFRTPTGRDHLVDENITIVFDRPPQGRKFSTNGPEWTRDDKGPLVVYTKADPAGIMQQWSARLLDGKPAVAQLTRNTFDCYGNMPSRFRDGKPPRIAYTYDWPIWKAKAAWIFADKPGEPHVLEGFDYNQMSMWSAVSPDFLFVRKQPGAPHGQVARANADTGAVTVLTNDEGVKDDPGLFLAPEFGGEMLLVCNVDNRALGIYRDRKSRDGFWTRIATLALPDGAPYKFVSSPETIAPATGVGGVSYFSLLAREGKDRNTPGSIWVLGLGRDEKNRFARRVDDGAAGGEQSVALEPEPFVGRREVYVYYNHFGRADGRHGLRRARTGIRVSGAAPAEGFQPREHGDEARAAGLDPKVLARIDVEMQRHVAAPDVAGIVALICRNGKVGYFETFGMQDREAQTPMPREAIFRLQSMTKPVIAACALSLYDEGKFTLDEPISKHCPEWAEPKVLENGVLVPAKSPITPRMLMSHSSGLYYGDIEKGARSKPGNEGAPFAPVAATNRGAKTTLKEFSEGLAKAPLKFHPGAGWQYGHSIDVLGRYIEAVAGKPLDEVLRERILGPLKMASTDFWVHPENAGRICQIYRQPRPGVLERGREAGRLAEKPTLFLGGQGLCGSTEDYERFCRMMMNRGELDGVRVLKAETADLMFQNHVKPEIGRKYGLGGAVDGDGGYAWGGANGTQFWIDRKTNLFAVFMVQTQRYRSPAFNDFKRLASEAAGNRGGPAAAQDPAGQEEGAGEDEPVSKEEKK